MASRIDSHLHLFNLSYLLQELINIGWDMVWGNYPHHKKLTAELAKAPGFNLQAVVLFAQWLKDLMEGSFLDAADQYKSMSKEFQKVFGSDLDYWVAPLMMDIFYMFAQVEAPQLVKAGKGFQTTNDPNQDFDNYISELKRVFPEAVQAGSSKLMGSQNLIDQLAQEFKQRNSNSLRALKDSSKYDFPSSLELSWGFESNFNELYQLQQNNKGRVFPFVAVDPRREGILDLVKQAVSANGPFYGVKLYPRLGYKIELSPFFVELFTFCVDHNIPITTHSSSGGMPPDMPISGFNPWPYDGFGAPAEWGPVLQDSRFQNLKVDLAHFGGPLGLAAYNTSTWSSSWTKQTLDLMKTYKNVYTDLSCYSDPKNVAQAKTILNDPQYTFAQSRVLFGTDNPVVFLTNPGKVSYNSYYTSFDQTFGSDLVPMMSTNAVPFLNL